MFTFKEYGVADVIIQMFTDTSEEQHVWVEGETLPQRYAHVREKNSWAALPKFKIIIFMTKIEEIYVLKY